MKVYSLFLRSFHATGGRLAAIALLGLIWTGPAFCSSPIEKAIKNGDLGQVKTLIEADPSLIKKKLLASAARFCKKDIAEYLISQHAEVDQRDFLGLTPLFEAAGSGCVDVAQVLLVHGANVNAKNRGGETPLWWANSSRKSNVADVLRLFGGK